MRIELPKDEPQVKGPAADNLAEDMLEVAYLSRSERRKYRKEQEKKKKENMTKAEKRQYFLDYYKWPTIVGIILLIAGVILCINIYQNMLPTALNLAILNNKSDIINYDELENDYRSTYEVPSNNKFLVHYNYTISYEDWSSAIKDVGSTDSTQYEQLVAYTKSDYYDAIITDAAGYEYCTGTGLVFNLKNVMSDDDLEKYSEYILYETIEDGSIVPIGINISKANHLDKFQLSYDEIYLVFPCNSDRNITNLNRLIKYLLG